MSYVRYKKFGTREYAYKVTQIKDESTGKFKQKQQYLGAVVDKEKRIFEKRNAVKRKYKKELNEKLILDYGDTYLQNKIMEQTNLLPILKDIFKDKTDTLLSMIFYRIQGGSAMKYTENWYEGNIAKVIYPLAKVTSQNISEFLKYLSSESLQRKFFSKYIGAISGKKKGVIIDSTGLPNEIHFPLTDWGHHNGGIEKETRLILAVDKDTKLPLYFRYVAGNISDVSTLSTTIEEIKKLGVTTNISIMDAGYCSENNITELYNNEISFLTRMPSSRKIYKRLITDNVGKIECTKNAVKYDERGLFIKKEKIDLYGNVAYAYIVCDPERRGREISKQINRLEGSEEIELENCGMMILISNLELDTSEVIPMYYTRQMAEQLFGISKDDLSLLPVRVHTEDTFRGFIFLIFLSLIIYTKLREKLGKEVSVEQAISTMRNLKCKIYSDDSIVVSEPTKQQKSICEKCNIPVPKNSGI